MELHGAGNLGIRCVGQLQCRVLSHRQRSCCGSRLSVDKALCDDLWSQLKAALVQGT